MTTSFLRLQAKDTIEELEKRIDKLDTKEDKFIEEMKAVEAKMIALKEERNRLCIAKASLEQSLRNIAKKKTLSLNSVEKEEEIVLKEENVQKKRKYKKKSPPSLPPTPPLHMPGGMKRGVKRRVEEKQVVECDWSKEKGREEVDEEGKVKDDEEEEDGKRLRSRDEKGEGGEKEREKAIEREEQDEEIRLIRQCNQYLLENGIELCRSLDFEEEY